MSNIDERHASVLRQRSSSSQALSENNTTSDDHTHLQETSAIPGHRASNAEEQVSLRCTKASILTVRHLSYPSLRWKKLFFW